MVLTTNRAFKDWGKIFHDNTVASASLNYSDFGAGTSDFSAGTGIRLDFINLNPGNTANGVAPDMPVTVSISTAGGTLTHSIDVAGSGLSPVIVTRIMAAIGPTISASSSSSRSQWRNRAGAWTAAFERLDEASKPPPPPRRPTRPKRGAVLDRLDDKRKASERKQTRRRPSVDDE